MWFLYQIALALAVAVAGPWLLLRRRGHHLPTLSGRLGGSRGEVPKGPLWIHAVSVGEVRVAATLSRRLPAEWPLLVTTVTPTGQQQARAMLGTRAAVAYLPFDLSFAIGRFLDRFEPRALILVEGDYWPLLLRHVTRRGLPIVTVNGRVSETTARRLRRVPWVARRLYGPVRRFAVQTTDDRERLATLGVDRSKVVVTGNLKFDADLPGRLPDVEARLLAAAGGRPLVIAGSTMDGEDARVLDAFAGAGGGDRALLVIAPRHPERWAEVEQLARRAGFVVQRRSALADGDRPSVVLLDTLGELPALYRLARAAFVGGTLVPTGGHNPLEPALHGVPVAVGPSMDNFRQIAAEFDLAAGWRRVADSDALAAFFDQALGEDLELRAAAARGRELVAANRGAAERTLAAIEPYLEEAMG